MLLPAATAQTHCCLLQSPAMRGEYVWLCKQVAAFNCLCLVVLLRLRLPPAGPEAGCY